MRILILNYEFPPVGGGGGRAAEGICLGLASRGHEVRVQTAWVKGLPFIDQYNGITVYRSFAFRHRSDRASVLEMGLYIVTGFLPALKHVQEWEPHVIHAHFAVPTGALAWLVSRFTRVPYILTAHLGDVPDAVPEQTKHLFHIVKPLTFPIWNDAAAVVAVSQIVRNIALQSYHVPIEVIPNGVDLAASKLSPITSSVPPKMIFAGRFNPQKNLLFLIDLLAEVRDLPWEMNILGDGPLMEVVKAQSK
jgi:glycosyltransferase involved in cell wall biosynthesis